MIIKCEQFGEVEVLADGSAYGEDLRGEAQSIFISGEDMDPAHKATIERLMEDIRKPAVALRDYVMSFTPSEY